MPKGQWYKKWEYIAYRDDEVIGIGDMKEICRQLKIKPNTFYIYRTRTNQDKGNIKIIRIDKEGE